MGESKGWIALHRNIQDHWIWTDKPFSKGQAWIDMLLLANHSKGKMLVGEQVLEIEPGSFVTSWNHLAIRWGWDESKVRRFATLLEKEEMITRKSTNKYTTIYINNYNSYQCTDLKMRGSKQYGLGYHKGKKDVEDEILAEIDCLKKQLEEIKNTEAP